MECLEPGRTGPNGLALAAGRGNWNMKPNGHGNGSTKRLPREERRRQILKASLELFAERGYRNTTTSALAARVGVAEPVLYQHFEGKKEILLTLLSSAGRRVLRHWEKLTEGIDDPLDRIEAIALDYPRYFLRHASEMRLVDNVISETSDAEIRRVLRRNYRSYEAFFSNLFQEAIDRGLIAPSTNPRVAAWVVIGIGKAIGFVRHAGLKPLPAEEFVSFSVQRFVRGLRDENLLRNPAAFATV